MVAGSKRAAAAGQASGTKTAFESLSEKLGGMAELAHNEAD